ncbi:nitrogenase stabilizing/protective protein NifW [Rhizobium sullae]|uniref:Nitrogenase-stabilizing/protective protein NifW n=1 Tax=Rhizobium sullae TaxID=50338 RepID=A0A4V2V7S9_RHISU|nr:nitrogenase stabilizing/protective protein NifW [Rhizobium sullae]TCU04035.1 nitrogenase-stabilizing/protective protein [Rhizobium sullae]UWU19386.1 nitrogenase stabilizing/protective protein NifW [Rhizobium sullae]
MNSCAGESNPIDVINVLERLKRLSAAEEFFEVLGVSYDVKVLNVSRLHIMKRMGQYLAEEDHSNLPDKAIAACARATLARAYDDFATSSPLSHRVFKVLKDRDPTKAAPPRRIFVALGPNLTSFEQK